ncbi:MAG: hypothetical protein FJ044_02195, partial [Candidatus Cloacimonetes bacterium]|nr:hypothetical protein [Candidatus Cloacimonadota bacterium]
MKKIIKSLGVIAAMSVIVIGATRAYFSDQETSKGNVLSAGTIDISVDGQNPWTAKYTDKLTDMKPSQVRYVSFTVKNVGANPVRVWKHLGSFVTATGTINEPECTAENGVWGGTTCTGSPTPIDNLDGVV